MRDHSLAAGAPAVAAVREEQLRLAARAQVGARDLPGAGGTGRLLGRGPQVAPPAGCAAGAGGSSRSRPRWSVSKGVSLTPPTRVQNATAYGPGASQRISCRSLTDQLSRRRQLRLAAVELAAQPAAAELLQHLAHPPRHRQ